jgi:ribose 1,5-bisphosphokinase
MSASPEIRQATQGRLVLVVGPSGAGKDALIERAKLAFASDKRVVFARRIVTRAALAEDHDTLDTSAFDAAEKSGAYLLSWHAHDLGYGLPIELKQELEQGRVVVANVSRGIILAAEDLGYPVHVLHFTADPVILATRIAARGRESMAEVRARVGRIAPLQWRNAHVVEIRNEGTLEHGAALFINALALCVAPGAAHDAQS